MFISRKIVSIALAQLLAIVSQQDAFSQNSEANPGIELEKGRNEQSGKLCEDCSPQAEVSKLRGAMVRPGCLESERKSLLTTIGDARASGVGITSYMAAFARIESMVEQREPETLIKDQIDKLLRTVRTQLNAAQSRFADAPSGDKPIIGLKNARLYVLSLLNSDREKHHLLPLSLDNCASNAGQSHTDEMAEVGYLSHWDCAGKKPDQRYTEKNGTHSVSENLGQLQSRSPGIVQLEKEPYFSKADLRQLEEWFISEKPPNDGHRKQILKSEHNRVGIGISLSKCGNERSVYLAQEFVDSYGDYSSLPYRIYHEKPFVVEGKLAPGVSLYSVSIRWEIMPEPLSLPELREKSGHYTLPDTSVADFFKEDKRPPLKVWKEGSRELFSLSVNPSRDWKAGLYYIMICANVPGLKSPAIISSRVLVLK